MKKLFYLPLLSLFLFSGCSKDDDAVTPTPEPPEQGGENPDGENPDGENPDEEGLYTVPDRLADYYEEADLTLEGEELYEDLAALTISKHTTFLDYGQRHDYLYDADADLSNPENVVLVYSGESVDWRKYQSPSNPHFPESEQIFNTEHIYPQSFLEDNASNDLHVMRVVDRDINGQRSNHPYTDGEGQYELINGDSFYPGDEWRGDVARIVMYMNLRYDEPFEDVGNLDLFLEWNAEDPVSNFEIQRNDVIERAQGNRNPFIDNPHLATNIWGGEEADNRWDGESEVEDNEAPSVPEGLTVSDPTFETLRLSWEASTDNETVAKYYIYVDGEYYTTVTSTSITVEDLQPGTTYSFTISAADPTGNESAETEAVEGTTEADEEAPSVPESLSVTSVTATSIGLDWDASTDNAAVQGYDIYIDGEFYENVTATEYTIAGLTAETTYSFTVSAVDIYGNESEATSAVEATTEQESDNSTSASIIISEYIEGAHGYNKVIEIANISGETVDLTAYSLMKITNDDEEWDNEFVLDGVLESGEVLVIANDKADLEGITRVADILTSEQIVNFNGNDPVGLFKDGELIDMIGEKGGADFAKDVDLRRKTTVTSPSPVFTPDEWTEHDSENTDDLGNF